MLTQSAFGRPAIRHWPALLVFVAAVMVAGPRPAAAFSEPEAIVEKAKLTVEKLMVDPNLPQLRHYMDSASGVFIVPALYKGGFLVGGEGGSGVLMVKGADGTWSSPAFYTMAGASFGLQIGGEVSEVIFTIMNKGAVEAMLQNQFKLGADASVAVGPIGKGVGASTTTNFSDDVYAFSTAVGLFGGGALQGAAIFDRSEWNELYYAAGADPTKIVLDRRYFNPHAESLRAALPN